MCYNIRSPGAENWSKSYDNPVMAPLAAKWQSKSLKLKDLFQVTVINESQIFLWEMVECYTFHVFWLFVCDFLQQPA